MVYLLWYVRDGRGPHRSFNLILYERNLHLGEVKYLAQGFIVLNDRASIGT